MLVAFLKYRRADGPWRETPMRLVDNDRWAGAFPLPATGPLRLHGRGARRAVSHVARRPRRSATPGTRSSRAPSARGWRSSGARRRGRLPRPIGARSPPTPTALRAPRARRRRWRSPVTRSCVGLMGRHLDRTAATRADRELEVVVDRERARFAAWYEMFPRSGAGRGPERHFSRGGEGARARLRRWASTSSTCRRSTRSAARTARARNNDLVAGARRSGQPLGHRQRRRRLHGGPSRPRHARRLRSLRRARARGSGSRSPSTSRSSARPDHPWVREHPEWFFHRPDGTIKYAENPPKKYQDIYPLNFQCADPRPLWEAMRRILEFWIGHGVRTFRVDNPHTKPVKFWEWLIRAVQDAHPRRRSSWPRRSPAPR